tara:strand:+ start:1697 stop:1831 length:135 start_codon:yes stop_codon:yes gene_type:complete
MSVDKLFQLRLAGSREVSNLLSSLVEVESWHGRDFLGSSDILEK